MKTFVSIIIDETLQHQTGTTRSTMIQLYTGKSIVIKHHHLISKIKDVNGKMRFDQLTTVSSSTSP